MEKFITDMSELPKSLQEAIIEDIETRIIPQAVVVRDDMPEKFLEYIEAEVNSADEAMRRMIFESRQPGTNISNVSEIYVYNKERKKALLKLKKEWMQRQDAAEPHRVAAKPHQAEESRKTHVWELTDEEKGRLAKYSPSRTFPAEKHLKFLITNNVIDANMGSTYLADVVQRAHFGKMYEWADRNGAKTKLRAYVHRVAQKYYPHNKDYVNAAAKSMEIKKEALQKHECPMFDKELKRNL